MNFFEQQQLARRNTRRMLVLFALAVVAVVLAVDLVLAAAWRWGFPEIYGAKVPTALYVWGSVGTLTLILGASLFHMLRLRAGGDAIARLAGAERVLPDTRDPLERRLVNVVEEMAIAAGTRVPAVYVMKNEAGINAFAAGYDVSNSVIAVTRGALQTLNRDELQGVVGHEFSHIVNGDVSLNIRMMGVLGGIVFIGAIGEFLMRSSRRGRRDSSAHLVMVGFALMVIGYVGLFFARLIKAAVSRQREFLADAASVQFTRNPSGIAGALDQIRASGAGTLIANRYAEDMSHMFFGQGVQIWFARLFDTHPPVEVRIKRILPNFAATQYRAQRRSAAPGSTMVMPAMVQAFGQRAGDQAHAWAHSVQQSVALVGALDAAKVDYAQQLLERLPKLLREALRKKETASAALVAMMLARPPEVMEKQMEAARAANAGRLAEAARQLAAEASTLPPEMRLPVVDLALPAIKLLAAEAQQDLVRALEAVIHADRRVSLHEFVVLTLVRSQLIGRAKPKGHKSISALRPEVVLVLSLLAHSSRGSGAEAEKEVASAFLAGAKQLGLTGVAIVPRGKLSLQACGDALDRLSALAPLAKAELVGGFFAAVTADKKVRVSEAELMRMVGAALECPVPPLFEQL